MLMTLIPIRKHEGSFHRSWYFTQWPRLRCFRLVQWSSLSQQHVMRQLSVVNSWKLLTHDNVLGGLGHTGQEALLVNRAIVISTHALWQQASHQVMPLLCLMVVSGQLLMMTEPRKPASDIGRFAAFAFRSLKSWKPVCCLTSGHEARKTGEVVHGKKNGRFNLIR